MARAETVKAAASPDGAIATWRVVALVSFASFASLDPLELAVQNPPARRTSHSNLPYGCYTPARRGTGTADPFHMMSL